MKTGLHDVSIGEHEVSFNAIKCRFEGMNCRIGLLEKEKALRNLPSAF
jgi:hypothetical protein